MLLLIKSRNFFVKKLNDNPQNAIFFHYSRRASPVPLMFGGEEIEVLMALENYEEKGDVFKFLREACAGVSFYTRCTMLISTLEAIAGEDNKSMKPGKHTNKEYINNEILRDNALYEQLYAYGSGLRSHLMHGKHLDLKAQDIQEVDFIGKIYRAILRYFREKCGARISEEVVSPMRGPLGNYKVWRSWLEPILENTDLSLQNIHTLFSAQTGVEEREGSETFNKSFRLMPSMPKNY